MLIILLLLLFHQIGSSQTWHWKSRFEGALVYDSNVFENFQNPVDDRLGRFFWELTGKNRYQRVNTFMQFKGGLDGYSKHTIENRMVNELKGNHAFPITKRLAGSISYRLRARTFFKSSRDYLYISGSPAIQYQISRYFKTLFALSTMSFYFKGNPNYNYNFLSARFALSGTIHSLLLRFHIRTGTISYNRNAIDYVNLENGYWADKGMIQKDNIIEGGIGFETYSWALVQTYFTWRQDRSNSYGSSYDLYQIHLILAKPLPWKMTCKLIGHLYLKSYNNSFDDIIQILPDTELEENTYLIFDIAKDVSDKHEIYVRTAWYKNESPFRNRYYEKFLFSAGCSFRFSKK